ncbi:hypothetical protein DMN91_003884 [Ooceraea biroi]|uniref:Odorant receptor n=1 Tax=Ooceraea biroi TaxID=2015173 RepID=A0A3L8DVA2_OOCBI|nr:uncharacterized protein LOC105283918 isoform X2 [Ooceraea biroi]RLU23678.1 hypothetical protein DMN91_003884 [Ooceraea biroi]
MDFIGEQYYNLNRILLVCVGLWPYGTSSLKKIQIIFFEAIFISFLLCQLNVFLVKNCSIAKVMKILMFVIINCIFIIKYNAGLLLTDNIKYIFNRVRYDWTILKNQAELDIIQKYACNARFHTITFMLIGIVIGMGIIILSSISFILDAIIPLNESRPLWLPIIVEYFVDQERYFFAILIHTFMFVYVGCITIAAIATMLIAYVLHNCAIFEVASYRIEHIFDKTILQMSKDIRQHILYERLIHAVYLHRRAVDLANILTNSFATLYFILLTFGVASTSFSVFHFFHVLTPLNDVLELIMTSIFIILHLYYIYIGNYVGQSIIDTSTNIFRTTFNTEWYTAPLWLQKVTLFIMQRSSIKSTLTAGGIFDASLEGFAKLMSMSISYVMFLRSTRSQQENTQEEL